MPQLDGLRAFAVLAVIYSHYIPSKYHFKIPWGSAGVQLFFILSGFLITSILIKSRGECLGKALKTFYIRRAFRIFPLYYLVLILCILLELSSVTQDFFWHLSYLSNVRFFIDNGWPGTGSHLWSLSVEEQFYLFWPLALLSVRHSHVRKLVFGLLSVGITLQIAKPFLFEELRLISVLTFMNFDSLGAGALLALWFNRDNLRQFGDSAFLGFILPFLAFLGISIMANFHEVDAVTRVFQRLCMILSFTFIIYNAAKGTTPSWISEILLNPLIVWLGKISYGLYIWHGFVPEIRSAAFRFLGIIDDTLTTGFPALFIHLGMTILISAASWKFFEAPLNRLKNRWA